MIREVHFKVRRACAKDEVCAQGEKLACWYASTGSTRTLCGAMDCDNAIHAGVRVQIVSPRLVEDHERICIVPLCSACSHSSDIIELEPGIYPVPVHELTDA